MNTSTVEGLLAQTAWYASAAGSDPSVVNSTFSAWITLAPNYTVEQVASYVLAYFYFNYVLVAWRHCMGTCYVLVGAIGFIGYVLEAIVLQEKEFKLPSFIYHKAIVAFGFITTSLFFYDGIMDFIIVQPYASYFAFQIVSFPLSIFTYTSGDLITLFMTVDRVCALWLPTSYTQVNRPRVVFGAIAVSLLASAFITLPDAFRQTVAANAAGGWMTTSTAFSKSELYTILSECGIVLRLCSDVALFALAVAVVVGLARYNRSHAKLTGNSDDHVMRNLTVLNLACVPPIIVYGILRASNRLYFQYYTVGAAAIVSMSYDVAMANITLGIWNWIIASFIDTALFLQNCTHFFVYTACSTLFRETARRVLLGKMLPKVRRVSPVAQQTAPPASSGRCGAAQSKSAIPAVNA